MSHRVIVPDLTLENTIEFVSELYALPQSEAYLFDFKGAKHFEPISLLYLSSEINRCRQRHQESRFSVTNHKHCTYAAHMGFFQAFGADFGNFPDGLEQEVSSTTYLPIRILNSYEIREQAYQNMIPVGEYIENLVKGMTTILVQDTSINAYGVLAYSLREIIRNVVEHSETIQFAFCAQFWPSKHIASLAILDRGIGIRSSLSSNPFLNLNEDFEAIEHALLPGISGKMYKGKKSNKYDHWQNSGYGLYMTSEICKKGGTFFIASGSAGMKLEGDKRSRLNVGISGTLINLTIDTTSLYRVEDMLMDISVELKRHGTKSQIPSKASTTFSKDNR